MTADEITILQYFKMPNSTEKEAINAEIFEITGQSGESSAIINKLMSIVRAQRNVIKAKDIDNELAVQKIVISRVRKQILEMTNTKSTTIADIYTICVNLSKYYGFQIEPSKTSVLMYYTYINQIKNTKTDG